MQPVIEYLEYLVGGTVLGNGIGIIDTVDKAQSQRLVGTEPMVLAVEIQRTDLILVTAHTCGIHLAKRVLQGLDLTDAAQHLVLVAVTASLHAVEHQAGITAHLNRLPAKGDDAGHAGGDAVHVDGDIRLAVTQRVENGDTGIYLAAVAVDTHVNPAGLGFGLQELAGDITAAHIVIIADVTVKQDAAGVLTGYDVEKLSHASCRFKRVSPQSSRCEIRGIKAVFQTAYSSCGL